MRSAFIFNLDGLLANNYSTVAASLHYVERQAHLARVRQRQEQGASAPPADGGDIPWPHGPHNSPADPFFYDYMQAAELVSDLFPQVYDVIQTLHRRGNQISVASNKPVRLSQALMEHLALDVFLAGVYGPESVGEPKPHPAIVYKALSDMSVRPVDVLYVGDSVLDIDTARSAGVAVAVYPGSDTMEELAAGRPDHLIGDLHELLYL